MKIILKIVLIIILLLLGFLVVSILQENKEIREDNHVLNAEIKQLNEENRIYMKYYYDGEELILETTNNHGTSGSILTNDDLKNMSVGVIDEGWLN